MTSQLGVELHTFHPNTWEAKAGRTLSGLQRVPRQPELYRETLSRKTNPTQLKATNQPTNTTKSQKRNNFSNFCFLLLHPRAGVSRVCGWVCGKASKNDCTSGPSGRSGARNQYTHTFETVNFMNTYMQTSSPSHPGRAGAMLPVLVESQNWLGLTVLGRATWVWGYRRRCVWVRPTCW